MNTYVDIRILMCYNLLILKHKGVLMNLYRYLSYAFLIFICFLLILLKNVLSLRYLLILGIGGITIDIFVLISGEIIGILHYYLDTLVNRAIDLKRED